MSSSQHQPKSHRGKYKNAGLDSAELRRRREEEGVQLRKQKKDSSLAKRRNVEAEEYSEEQGDIRQQDTAIVSVSQEAPPIPIEPAQFNFSMDDAIAMSSASLSSDADAGEVMPVASVNNATSVVVIPDEMVEAIFSQSAEAQLKATQELRRILSKTANPPIDQVIELGIVPRLVQFLWTPPTSPALGMLRYEAAWALTNVASGSPEQTRHVVQAGAVPILVSLLESADERTRQQAVWALGNIAGDSPACRDYVTDQGIVSPLLGIVMSHGSLSITRNAVWCLFNLCRGKHPLPDFAKLRPCLPVLAKLLFHPDETILTHACYSLSNLADGPDEQVQSIVNTGACRRLVELLTRASAGVVVASLRVLGIVLTGNDEQAKLVLRHDLLPPLAHLLTTAPSGVGAKESVRMEACWVLSNITAGNEQQIQDVIDAGIFPAVIEIIAKSDFKSRREAAYVISNATRGGTFEQVDYLVRLGCIPPLCDLFSVADTHVLKVALSSLENILRHGAGHHFFSPACAGDNPNVFAVMVEQCGGMERIAQLQGHENEEIYRKAFTIIDEYFDEDDNYDDDDGLDGIYPLSQVDPDGPSLEFTLPPLALNEGEQSSRFIF